MKRTRRNELDPVALDEALEDILERCDRLIPALPRFLLMADHLRWDPAPKTQILDQGIRPSVSRIREDGEVDDTDGIGHPTEDAALRLLAGGSKNDRTRALIQQAARAVLLASDALAMAENKLRSVDGFKAKADEPTKADVCIRCQKPGAGLKAGFCQDCHSEWVAAGFPDHDPFSRSLTPVTEET